MTARGAGMALGRQGERQADLMIGWAELPRSPGHAFYDRLQAVLMSIRLAQLPLDVVPRPTLRCSYHRSSPQDVACG